jgi:hypothetical protein
MGAFAEARYFGWEKIEADQTFPVKGRSLSAEQILGSAERARPLCGGPVRPIELPGILSMPRDSGMQTPRYRGLFAEEPPRYPSGRGSSVARGVACQISRSANPRDVCCPRCEAVMTVVVLGERTESDWI